MRKAERRSRSLAKGLRGRMTDAEVILWSRLRFRVFHGHKFRRQHPIGSYVADFACIAHRLVLEVDGATHSTPEQLAHDKKRDTFLRDHGWRVMRVTNEDIYRNLDRMLDMLGDRLAPTVPLAEARGTPPP